ncbi:MAG: SDR family oxidoreductase [Porticoccaceae bacterium]
MNTDYLNYLFSLEGKVALVTGGRRGIGKMIADALVEAGCKVYVVSRSPEIYADRHSIASDLASMASLEELVGEVARRETQLHILVNNAGYFSAGTIDQACADDWNRVMDINVRAPFFLVQKLLPLLQRGACADDPARVVNIGSIGGVMGPSNRAYAYGASKAGIHQLTRNLAADLGRHHITVNAIMPGYFPSDMTDGFFAAEPGLKDMILSRIPRGRLGSADDIGGLTVALCGRSGAYITGTVTPLDGGALLN